MNGLGKHGHIQHKTFQACKYKHGHEKCTHTHKSMQVQKCEEIVIGENVNQKAKTWNNQHMTVCLVKNLVFIHVMCGSHLLELCLIKMAIPPPVMFWHAITYFNPFFR
uniref:Uncharacterized protein n=1 Tax=Rhizophora mucronata TaxID=61149 RepID=A0A2P2QFD2_RHIMU